LALKMVEELSILSDPELRGASWTSSAKTLSYSRRLIGQVCLCSGMTSTEPAPNVLHLVGDHRLLEGHIGK
jgi:hypothetical protein